MQRNLFFVAKLQWCFSLRKSRGATEAKGKSGENTRDPETKAVFFSEGYTPLYHHPNAETRPGLGDVSFPQKNGEEHGGGTLRFP